MVGATKEVKSHAWERANEDWYVEPVWCSERLFEAEPFSGTIWDPCCGLGTIPMAALYAGFHSLGSDIANRREMTGVAWRQVDFLTVKKPHHNIVCNPPFGRVQEFGRHALSIATRKVAMIFPTARLNAARWLNDTPLSKIWLLTPRPSMPPGESILRGEKAAGGKVDFCWLVWTIGYAGEPTIGWLHRDGNPVPLPNRNERS